MIKRTQIFDWEHEPVGERPSESMPSRNSGSSAPASPGAFEQTVCTSALPEQRRPQPAPEAGRSPPNPSERTLSRLVPRWLDSLPPESRPDYLCAHFPRIANRLALCWAEPTLALEVLEDYLRDRRGTRRGFAPQALSELKSLRQLASQRQNRMSP